MPMCRIFTGASRVTASSGASQICAVLMLLITDHIGIGINGEVAQKGLVLIQASSPKPVSNPPTYAELHREKVK